MLPLNEFPEARELTAEQLKENQNQMKWLYAQAKARGMQNFVYFSAGVYTKAFGEAHGLDKEMPIPIIAK